MSVDLGDRCRLTYPNRDPAGTLVNAGVMTLTIGLPDGTATVISPVAPVSTGVYTYDYLTVQAGRHTVRWQGGGVNPGAGADEFDVQPATPAYLISLEDAKAQLGITSTTFDEELRIYVEAATGVVERHRGEVIAQRAVVEQLELASTRRLISLSSRPVIALTSVRTTWTGYTWDVATLKVDQQLGVVSAELGPWFWGHLEIGYTAGYSVVPAAWTLAARIVVEHLWQTRRGSAGGPRVGGMDDTMAVPGMGFSIPNRALELLGAPTPGVA